MYVPKTDTQVSTYATRLRARTNYKHPCNTSFGYTPPNLPEEYRDRIAEAEYVQKLYGSSKKPKVCTRCNIAVPATGICEYC